MSVFTDVRRFAIVADSPNFKRDGRKFLELAKNLIKEEVETELLPAMLRYEQNPSLENLAECVDGALDGIYVLAFYLNQMGFDSDRLWAKLQAANMSKFPDGVAKKNPLTGKVMKPEGWQPPNWMDEMIEWNTEQRGESYKAGLIHHIGTREVGEKPSNPEHT